MIGQPGGTVRPPRLPVTDPDKLRQIREILIEEQIMVPEATSAHGTAA